MNLFHPAATSARALAIIVAGLSLSGCLTSRETRSIKRQVREIGAQVGQVRDTQERSRAALNEPEPARPLPSPPVPPHLAEASPRAAGVSAPPAIDAKPRPSPDAPAGAAQDVRYREGYALYHHGDFAAAESKLRAYLTEHPAGALSDNAQYWIGECRFARGEFRRAIAEFKTVVERFPAGNKAPDAHYKIALCHLKLGERDLARRSLSVVLHGYPRSDVAGLARVRLAGL